VASHLLGEKQIMGEKNKTIITCSDSSLWYNYLQQAFFLPPDLYNLHFISTKFFPHKPCAKKVLAFLSKTNIRNILLLQHHRVLSRFNVFHDRFGIAIIQRPPPHLNLMFLT
jgi:hypothetical protein